MVFNTIPYTISMVFVRFCKRGSVTSVSLHVFVFAPFCKRGSVIFHVFVIKGLDWLQIHASDVTAILWLTLIDRSHSNYKIIVHDFWQVDQSVLPFANVIRIRDQFCGHTQPLSVGSQLE